MMLPRPPVCFVAAAQYVGPTADCQIDGAQEELSTNKRYSHVFRSIRVREARILARNWGVSIVDAKSLNYLVVSHA